MKRKKRLCIECRWCDLRVDFDRGSNYCCLKTGEQLPAAILQRAACRLFEPQPAFPYWGP